MAKRKQSAKRAEMPANRLKTPRALRKPRNPNPPPPPAEYQFKPGQSGNPSGRPRLLSDAYRAQLARLVPNDPEGRTYAEAIASAMSIESLKGNVPAAREVRSATEGERIRTWRDDIIDLLRDGTLTPEQVSGELGDDLATELIAASGVRRGESREAETASDTTAES